MSGFWWEFAKDVAIGVLFGLLVVLLSWALGKPMFWPGCLVGGLVVALLTWNPGGER